MNSIVKLAVPQKSANSADVLRPSRILHLPRADEVNVDPPACENVDGFKDGLMILVGQKLAWQHEKTIGQRIGLSESLRLAWFVACEPLVGRYGRETQNPQHEFRHPVLGENQY